MVKIFKDLDQFEIYRRNLDLEIKLLGTPHSIGVVPTMGNLHIGHLSLIHKSLKDNDTTMVTIYVNPKQFGPKEDFAKYPRTLKDDILKIKKLVKKQKHDSKNLIIYAPSTDQDIYPSRFSSVISVKGLTENLCGKVRPGHFDGVATVVYRLFAITKPDCAYFGQKDYQQYLMIKKMVHDLDLKINIYPMPTKRDENGLALSSRNQFIKKDERAKALSLPKTLTAIKKIFKKQSFEKAYPKAIKEIQKKMKDKSWEYLEVLDSVTLKEPTQKTPILVIAGALKLSNTRLIDNKLVEVKYVH